MSDALIRAIDGVVYERDALPYAHELRVRPLGLHFESITVPRYGWHELDSDQVQADAAMCEAGNIWVDGGWQPAPPALAEEPTDRFKESDRDRALRRARAAVRRRVKFFNLDTMLTLTYRENVLVRSVMRRDVDALIKRMRRLDPSFEYVCVFEKQKRGAWHAHIACRAIMPVYVHRGRLVGSYALLRAMWRGVVGDRGGNIDVSRRKAAGRSVGKLAGYLSKYLGKNMGDDQDGDSYSASGRLPDVEVIALPSATYLDACAMALKAMCSRYVGLDFHMAHLDGGAYFLSGSPP